MLAEEKIGKMARKIIIKYLRDDKVFEIPLTELQQPSNPNQ